MEGEPPAKKKKTTDCSATPSPRTAAESSNFDFAKPKTKGSARSFQCRNEKCHLRGR